MCFMERDGSSMHQASQFRVLIANTIATTPRLLKHDDTTDSGSLSESD